MNMFNLLVSHSDLLSRADALAERAHAGQLRHGSDLPYITHPRAVAVILMQYTTDEVLLAAALTHDVLEDTEVSEADLRAELGDEVADLVIEVTDVATKAEGNRAARAAINAAHLAKASVRGMTLKLADILHNSSSSFKQNPGFAPVYLQEKLDQLAVLTEGDPKLFERVHEVVTRNLVRVTAGKAS